MADLADLFRGFASHWLDGESGRIFARSAGSGPPLVLLHGYPQTHVMWHKIAPALAEHFTVVIMDLRGYGWSDIPHAREVSAYSKRTMALDVVAAMQQLGHVHFALCGHDRGARVGYRLALDHPGRLSRLVIADIVPTLSMWAGMDAALAMKAYHWMFLAQPEPLPERLIGGAPAFFLDHTLASWTAKRRLDDFDREALAHYRAAFNDPARIHATCQDYRAGASEDRAHDAADRAAGRTTGCPTHIVWGSAGIARTGDGAGLSPLEAWRSTFAPEASGRPVDAGHFLAEENPKGTLDAILPFLVE